MALKNRLGEKELVMYAWVGEDDTGDSGVVGLKQGSTPAGMIPLAAMGHHLDRLAKLKTQMEALARLTGKKRYLVKFIGVEIASETLSGRPV
jgi:hypothetical protein